MQATTLVNEDDSTLVAPKQTGDGALRFENGEKACAKPKKRPCHRTALPSRELLKHLLTFKKQIHSEHKDNDQLLDQVSKPIGDTRCQFKNGNSNQCGTEAPAIAMMSQTPQMTTRPRFGGECTNNDLQPHQNKKIHPLDGSGWE